jgi:hypothetical protein
MGCKRQWMDGAVMLRQAEADVVILRVYCPLHNFHL